MTDEGFLTIICHHQILILLYFYVSLPIFSLNCHFLRHLSLGLTDHYHSTNLWSIVNDWDFFHISVVFFSHFMRDLGKCLNSTPHETHFVFKVIFRKLLTYDRGWFSHSLQSGPALIIWWKLCALVAHDKQLRLQIIAWPK